MAPDTELTPPAVPLPVPASGSTFCSTSVLFPPAPPSTTPVGAKPSVTPASPSTFRSRPSPPPELTEDPDTAVKVLLLLAPMDTPPLMVPALAKVLPVPAVPDAWKATRPVMRPVLTKFVRAPP